MHRKIGFLIGVIAILLSVSKAWAQSSHDEVDVHDADLPNSAINRFEIYSPDKRFSLGFRGHLQENNKFSLNRNRTANEWDPRVDISINRARLSIFGSALDPRLTYLVQLGFDKEREEEKRSPSEGSRYLLDYYANMAFMPKYLQLRIGKFRTPFSRQQLMSTSQMQFYDVGHVAHTFWLNNDGRNVGVMLHNGFDRRYEWALAVVNNGIVGRVGYNHNHIDGYDMVDFSGGRLRFGVAANGFVHSDFKTAQLDDVRAGVDFIVKYMHFSTNGALYYQREKTDIKAAHNFGAGVDAGYLMQLKYEPVLRFGFVRQADMNTTEILAGFNYYIYGHHLKVQSYAGTRLDNTTISKWIGGAQFQFAF